MSSEFNIGDEVMLIESSLYVKLYVIPVGEVGTVTGLTEFEAWTVYCVQFPSKSNVQVVDGMIKVV